MVDWNYPKTVEEAVARLKGELSLRDRVYIANLTQENLYLLHISLKAYVGQELGLLAGNVELIESCRIVSHSKELNPEHCLAVILKALWEDLRETHVLRVVGSEE
jgi:hypothetical protein